MAVIEAVGDHDKHEKMILEQGGVALKSKSSAKSGTTQSRKSIVTKTNPLATPSAKPNAILRLPDDVFIVIFKFMQPELPDRKSWNREASPEEIDQRFSWMKVTLVCKRFFEVAHSTSALWSTIDCSKGRVRGVFYAEVEETQIDLGEQVKEVDKKRLESSEDGEGEEVEQKRIASRKDGEAEQVERNDEVEGKGGDSSQAENCGLELENVEEKLADSGEAEKRSLPLTKVEKKRIPNFPIFCPIALHYQPKGHHSALSNAIIPHIPSTQSVLVQITDITAARELLLLAGEHKTRLEALMISNSCVLTELPSLEDDSDPEGAEDSDSENAGAPAPAALAVIGPTPYRGPRFEHMCELYLKDLRFTTSQHMRALTTMLEAMPLLDVLSIENAIAIPNTIDIANQHRLVSTKIRRMVFDCCVGVDNLLAYISIPAGVHIFVRGTNGRVLPTGHGLQGQFIGYDSASILVKGNGLQVTITQGWSTLTVEWKMEPECWEFGFWRLVRGIQNLTITSDEDKEVDVSSLYRYTPNVKKLQLNIRNPLSLYNALIPLGQWVVNGELRETRLGSLQRLKLVTSFEWSYIFEVVELVMKGRDEMDFDLPELLAEGRWFEESGETKETKNALREWDRAFYDVKQYVKRVAARRKQAATGGHEH